MKSTDSQLSRELLIQPSLLLVKNLQKLETFYSDFVGLEVLSKTDDRLSLGSRNTPVLELVSKPQFSRVSAAEAGLFHNAILFSSRSDLANTVFSLIKQAPGSYEGSADHLVSEAFYFHDPENNGLELYFDKPREEWKWLNGHVVMDTLYLDPGEYIRHHSRGHSPLSVSLGHVHLKVGDIESARRFYVEQLGFYITADMGSALFMSVGGYHHHVAVNTWLSRGAAKRQSKLGFGSATFILPKHSDIERLKERLSAANTPFESKGGRITVPDPWNNVMKFQADEH